MILSKYIWWLAVKSRTIDSSYLQLISWTYLYPRVDIPSFSIYSISQCSGYLDSVSELIIRRFSKQPILGSSPGMNINSGILVSPADELQLGRNVDPKFHCYTPSISILNTYNVVTTSRQSTHGARMP